MCSIALAHLQRNYCFFFFETKAHALCKSDKLFCYRDVNLLPVCIHYNTPLQNLLAANLMQVVHKLL